MARPRKETDRNISRIMDDIINPMISSYLNPEGEKDINGHAKISDLCRQYNLSNLKVRKLLVTAGVYQSPSLTKVDGVAFDAAEEVRRLYEEGKNVKEIESMLKLSRSTVNSLIPYSENGAYNLEEKIDGSRDEKNMSLAARRNKRYRKKKIVEKFRNDREREKDDNKNKISADEVFDRIREVDDMKKCACCGKETVNLVRVGNNHSYGLCCKRCATVILIELDERKEAGRDKKCKTDWIFNNSIYVTSSGERVSFPKMIFEVTADDGIVHSFIVSSHEYEGMTTYYSTEIYKVKKNGEEAGLDSRTEYSFSVYGDSNNDFELLEDLVQKTATGVKFKTIPDDGESPRDGGRIFVGEKGVITVKCNEFSIDGKTYESSELGNLFSRHEGSNIYYQIMDLVSPGIEKDVYLMPTKLNDKVLLAELDEIIGVFSKNGSGEYIGRENVPGFEVFFKKLLEKLSFFYECKSAGAGKITGMKMIKRLRKIDTDDEMFPEYQIREIQDKISEGEWFNHPEREEG